MRLIKGFLFSYSMREKTHAHRKLSDDVPADVKKRRLREMIDVFIKNQLEVTEKDIGRYHLVLVDSTGKKANQLKGKTDTYRSVLFELPSNQRLPILKNRQDFKEADQKREGWESLFQKEEINKGDYVLVKIDRCSSNSLFGTPVGKVSFKSFFEISDGKHFFT